MKVKELLKNNLISRLENNKVLCLSCKKEFTYKGIATHYHYSHLKEGIISKKNISIKLKGKTKKDHKIKNLQLKQQQIKEQKIIPKEKKLNRNQIKKFLKLKYGNNDLSNITRWLKIKYINVYDSIILNTNYLTKDCLFTERIFHIVNNLFSSPLCKECNNKTTFKTFYFGYYKYCSTKCIANDKKIKEKKKQTCLKKFGVEHQSQTNKFKEKIIKTNQEKFGVNFPSQSPIVKNKTKKYFLDKFKVDNPMKVKEIQRKCRKSLDKHHIKDSNFKYEIQNKTKKTFNKNFGVDHFMKSKQGVKTISKIIKSKYGVDNYFKSDIFLNKKREIFLKSFYSILKKIKIQLLDKEFKGAMIKHNWLCLSCNKKFKIMWNYIQQGYLCPNCYPRNNGKSIQEIKIIEYINSIIKNKQIIENDRTILKPKELDIYIPSKKIAIEFNGLYWHSEEKILDKNYHLNKTLECEKQGIQLIHIFEDEWLFKKDIVKSRLKQILNKSNSKRIHARKCLIKEIKPITKNKFLEKFHIQGQDKSNIKLGAFHQDELISVMTFSKGNIAKGSKSKKGIWELNRFCSNSNYHIPGIASKLLTYFKRNYEWKEIFSYADKRWSIGNLYYKLGFELEKETGINYWYVKDFQRIHRFNLRKRPNEPKDIPEWVLRVKEGYYKIWDCGSLKFKLINMEYKI